MRMEAGLVHEDASSCEAVVDHSAQAVTLRGNLTYNDINSGIVRPWDRGPDFEPVRDVAELDHLLPILGGTCDGRMSPRSTRSCHVTAEIVLSPRCCVRISVISLSASVVLRKATGSDVGSGMEGYLATTSCTFQLGRARGNLYVVTLYSCFNFKLPEVRFEPTR